MSTIAYALRAEYEGTVEMPVEFDATGTATRTETVPRYLGGVVNLGDDRELNIGAELESSGGRIVVDDSDAAAVNVLDGYPPLKRVPAGDQPLTVDQYADATVAQLRDELTRRRIGGTGIKADLIAALHADDARRDAGSPQPEPYTVEALAATSTDTPEA